MTIVTVNTRLARRLRRDFDRERQAAGDRCWESPDILPWRAWIKRLWDESVYGGRDARVLLSASQERVLWEQVIRASDEDLLNPLGAAKVAAQAWMILHSWRLPRTASAFDEVPDTAAFFAWMQAFQHLLKARGFITEAEVPDVVLGRGFERPGGFAGFDEMTPVQNSLFDGCEEVGLAPAVGSSQRKCGFADAPEEVRAAAAWARAQLEQNPAARLGVVFPDLAARRAAVSRIFAEVLGTEEAFHISAPLALGDVPVVRAAILALKLGPGLSPAEAGQFLRSRYFPRTLQEGARIDLKLRRRGVSRFRREHELLLIEGPQRPGGWSRTFSRIVAESGWPGKTGLNSYEFQAAEAWRDLLGEFAKLDAVLGDLTFESALEKLEELASETGFGAEETDEPVQILGMLEAAGARFDALWLGGLHDGIWPPGARPHPFLPLSLQRAAGMPASSVESQYTQARGITNRLLRSAEEVICSYPMTDGEASLRPSPFLDHMPALGHTTLVEQAVSPFEPNAQITLETLTNDPAPPLPAPHFAKGGMNVIVDQSACPFRAFATHRLGARGLDEAEPGLTPRERGTVTHAALEKIWNTLRSQKNLLATDDADLNELLRRSVRQALMEKLGEGSQSLTRIQALEVRRLSALLQEWLNLERRRPPFETIQIEAGRRYELGGLELEIRIDRVDRYEDGSLAILDYKTGDTSKPTQWETERPEAPQLPLYSTMMTEPVSTIAFGQLTAGALELKGVSERGEPGLKAAKGCALSRQIEIWRDILDALAKQFAEGRAEVDPTPKACNYCDLMAFCRVAELGEEVVGG
jgi:ATP-dependent helicase/nuclease subunit B